jgi:hypothetical protein
MASKKAADAHWAAENPGVPDPKPAFLQVISKAMSTFQMMMSSQILLPSMILSDVKVLQESTDLTLRKMSQDLRKRCSPKEWS